MGFRRTMSRSLDHLTLFDDLYLADIDSTGVSFGEHEQSAGMHNCITI